MAEADVPVANAAAVNLMQIAIARSIEDSGLWSHVNAGAGSQLLLWVKERRQLQMEICELPGDDGRRLGRVGIDHPKSYRAGGELVLYPLNLRQIALRNGTVRRYKKSGRRPARHR